jgi:histidinol-phosphate aminotransferase
MNGPVQEQPGLRLIRPYIPGTPIEDVQRELGLHDVIKLASNENPIGTSTRATGAIRDALSRLSMYPDGQCYRLRHALAEYLGFPPGQIVAGNGVDDLIVQTCMAFLDERCEVITSQSSFPIYDTYAHVMRATLIKTPVKDYGLDLEAMAAAIGPNTKVIFVCNPNNPTGTIVRRDKVESFMRKVPDHVLVVFDEAYYEFVAAPDFPDSLDYVRQGKKNVMVLRTFSKIYGLAGIRLGCGVASPEILAGLNKVKEPFTVNLLAQAAGIAALSDRSFFEETLAVNEQGRQFFYREFSRLGLRYVESHTNFVLAEVGPEAAEVQQGLLRRGVIVRPCAIYDLPHCLRITVGTPEQNARLIAAMEEVLPSVRQQG